MFRRERPQKGRYRQFHQVDVEAFGFASPTIDAEVIELALAYLDACGVAEHELRPQLRRRPRLPARLRRAAAARPCAPCPLDVRRLPSAGVETNPLRVLDCKVPEDQAAIDDAAPHHRPPLRATAPSTSPRCGGSSSSSASRTG